MSKLMQLTEISTKEAARIMGFSPNWVRYLAKTGQIPGHKPYQKSRKFLFYKEEIECCRINANVLG